MLWPQQHVGGSNLGAAGTGAEGGLFPSCHGAYVEGCMALHNQTEYLPQGKLSKQKWGPSKAAKPDGSKGWAVMVDVLF